MTEAGQLTRDAVESAVRYADTWLAHQQTYQRIPGVQAAVLYDDDVVLTTAYGHADVERDVALTPDYLFRVASHSKTFTATAVMQLVETGMLALDDAAGKWLPWPSPGLRDHASRDARALEWDLSGQPWTATSGSSCDPSRTRRPCAEIALSGAAVLPPNERFKYSNITFSLLGLVIRAASGQAYNDYVTTNIVERLGLGQHRARAGRGPGERVRRRLQRADVRRFASADRPRRHGGDVLGHGFLQHCRGSLPVLLGALLGRRPTDQRRLETSPSARRVGGRAHTGQQVRPGFRRHQGGGSAARRARWWLSGAHHTLGLRPRRLASRCRCSPTPSTARRRPWRTRSSSSSTWRPPSRSPRMQGTLRFCGRFANLWGVHDVASLGGQLLLLNPSLPDPTEGYAVLTIQDEATLRVTSGSRLWRRRRAARLHVRR